MDTRPHLSLALTLGATAALLLMGEIAHAQGQPLNVKFSEGEKGGVCYVGFPRDGRTAKEPELTLEFSYRVKDGNMGATVKANSWDFVEGKSEEKKVPMTLSFDTGLTTTSRSGGYDVGFNMDIWGGWGPGPNSEALLAVLKTAKTAKVKFDGTDLGAWDLQLKSLAWRALTECAERVKAKG